MEESRLGGENDVGGLVLEMRLDQRDRDGGEPVAEGLKALEQGLVERTEESRDPLDVEDVRELFGGAGKRRRARTRSAAAVDGGAGTEVRGRSMISLVLPWFGPRP